MRFAPMDDMSFFKRNRFTTDRTTVPCLIQDLALNLNGNGGSATHVFIFTLKDYVTGLCIPFSFSSRISRFLLKLGRWGFNASGINLARMSKDRFPF